MKNTNQKLWLGMAALCIALMSCATSAKGADLTYSETVNVSGISAEDLYTKVHLWFSNNFIGPDEGALGIPGFTIPEKSKIITADKDKGTIQAHYTFCTDKMEMENFAVAMVRIYIIYSAVEIQVSDGQYRLIFSNPRSAANTYQYGEWSYYKPITLWHGHVEVTHKVWNDLASALRDTVGGTLAR